MSLEVVVKAAPGLSLVVYAQDRSMVDAALYIGEYLTGVKLAFISSPRLSVRVGMAPNNQPDSIYFGNTRVVLPWLELLKVADFLRLDIPLPVKLGEQVPA